MQLINYYLQENVKKQDKSTYLSETIIQKMFFTNIYTIISLDRGKIYIIKLVFIGKYTKQGFSFFKNLYLDHLGTLSETLWK